MRVLQIGFSSYPGGIESFVINNFRKIIQYDVRYDFIGTNQKIAYENEILRLGGKIYRLPDIKKKPFKFIRELFFILKDYEVVHVNMLSAANIIPLLICRICKIDKIIAHSHNSNTEGLLRLVLHKINKIFLPYMATDFYACSQKAGEWLFPASIVRAKKITIIHNAIDFDKYKFRLEMRNGIREKMNLENHYILGCVGRLTKQKNLFFLIDVFLKVSKINDKAVLIIIGAGELEESLKNKVSHLGLSSKVIFFGLREDVNQFYSVFDSFCMPSLYEGLSFTAVEAQASGLNCYFSETMSTETKIISKVTFLSIDQKEAWVKAIVSGDEKYNRCDNSFKNAFVASGYDLDTEVKKLSSLYKEKS